MVVLAAGHQVRCILWGQGALFNSLAPGKFEWNFRHVFYKQILVIDGWGICCEIALIWMSLDFTDNQSTLVQVMAWCHQATSHYLSQCWPRSLSPYDVTRPQWVNKKTGFLCGLKVFALNTFCKEYLHIMIIAAMAPSHCRTNDGEHISMKSYF